jgi:Zn-dependent metalloprotease
MKNNYTKFALILCLFSLLSMAQNKLIEDVSYQKTLKFNTPIAKNKAIVTFLKSNKIDVTNTTFIAKKATSDPSGMTHQRNQQFYKGIKIEFGTLITHSINNNVVSINAELYNAKNVTLTPTLSSDNAFQLALTNIDAQKYLWEDAVQAKIVGYEMPIGEIVLFPIVKSGVVTLAYKFDIYALEPVSRNEIYVDAHNGKILYKNPIIKHAHDFDSTKKNNMDSDTSIYKSALLTGNASTKYSGARSIETEFNSGLNMYVLSDNTRGNGIITYNCERLVNTYQNVHFTDNDNNWTTAEHANSFFDNAAQDAHWGAEMTYDFWLTVFNRNSFDDNNSQIKSYVHYQQTSASLSNAFWNGAFMSYGDGSSKPFTPIDICGHEIGHAVCQYTAALAYQNQSGAMNEGFSDIWGACIEHFGRTGSFIGIPVANVWKVGEDVATGGLRSMSNPNSKGDPDTFQGTNWYTTGDEGSCVPTSGNTGNDHCGVHTNSGVLNHWFYILTAGKAGTNNAPIAVRDTYNVTGIGIVKSAQIAYLAERDYLTPNATYFDMRDASITVANNLYCSVSPEVIAVTNAWNAVNIGNAFVSYSNDVSLKEIPNNASVACGNTVFSPIIVFDNLGTNLISALNITYNIDGGANQVTSWSGNITTCSSGTKQLAIDISALAVGIHVLNITTTLTGDGNTTNNSKSTVFFVNSVGNSSQVNTFENNSDDLIAYNEFGINSLWARGTSLKATLTNTLAGNSKVYTTNLSDVYSPSTKAYLVSKCYDLSQIATPVLKFDMAFDIESNNDILYMQYSTNGGNSWSLLGTANDQNWYTSNSSCPICIGGEWTGEASITNISGFTNDTKRQYSYNLSGFGSNSATPQSNIIFRFVFQSNDSIEYDGAIIDNFVVDGTLSNNQSVFNDFKVFPNPATNFVTVSFSSLSNDAVNYSLIDVQGRVIQKYSVNGTVGAINEYLNISEIPNGFYILKIAQGNLQYNTKIVKE